MAQGSIFSHLNYKFSEEEVYLAMDDDAKVLFYYYGREITLSCLKGSLIALGHMKTRKEVDQLNEINRLNAVQHLQPENNMMWVPHLEIAPGQSIYIIQALNNRSSSKSVVTSYEIMRSNVEFQKLLRYSSHLTAALEEGVKVVGNSKPKGAKSKQSTQNRTNGYDDLCGVGQWKRLSNRYAWHALYPISLEDRLKVVADPGLFSLAECNFAAGEIFKVQLKDKSKFYTIEQRVDTGGDFRIGSYFNLMSDRQVPGLCTIDQIKSAERLSSNSDTSGSTSSMISSNGNAGPEHKDEKGANVVQKFGQKISNIFDGTKDKKESELSQKHIDSGNKKKNEPSKDTPDQDDESYRDSGPPGLLPPPAESASSSISDQYSDVLDIKNFNFLRQPISPPGKEDVQASRDTSAPDSLKTAGAKRTSRLDSETSTASKNTADPEPPLKTSSPPDHAEDTQKLDDFSSHHSDLTPLKKDNTVAAKPPEIENERDKNYPSSESVPGYYHPRLPPAPTELPSGLPDMEQELAQLVNEYMNKVGEQSEHYAYYQYQYNLNYRNQQLYDLQEEQYRKDREQREKKERARIQGARSILDLVGRKRGIQGDHNSCYMDATLFAMFVLNSQFDKVLLQHVSAPEQPGQPNNGSGAGAGGVNAHAMPPIKDRIEIQRILREEIANPLRKNFYVTSDKIKRFRGHIEKSTGLKGFSTEEKDPEELINLLFDKIVHIPSFIQFSNGQTTNMYQLFLTDEDKTYLPKDIDAIPSVRQLLFTSLISNDLKFSNKPSCLVLQMPRFGTELKLCKFILAGPVLDITDLIANKATPRECGVCGKPAVFECKQCELENLQSKIEYEHKVNDHVDLIATGFYCETCFSRLTKKHTGKGTNHAARKIDQPLPAPPQFQNSPGADIPNECNQIINEAHWQLLHDTTGETPEVHTNLSAPCPPIRRARFYLHAIMCIEKSHYVTFVRTSHTSMDAPWIFFDSMADRVEQASHPGGGYNIPEVKVLADPELAEIWRYVLKTPRIIPALQDKSKKFQYVRRFFGDPYVIIYISDEDLASGPPLSTAEARTPLFEGASGVSSNRDAGSPSSSYWGKSTQF